MRELQFRSEKFCTGAKRLFPVKRNHFVPMCIELYTRVHRANEERTMNRRRHTRMISNRRVDLYSSDAIRLCKAAIGDWSASGAKLFLTSPDSLPKAFTLVTREGEEQVRCSLSWQHEAIAGIAFR